MASITIVSTACAETDFGNKTQVTNNSFDVGGFAHTLNESYAYFPLSALADTAIVTKWTLKLRQFSGAYYAARVSIWAAPCVNYIEPGSVHWNNKPAPSDSGYACAEIEGNVGAERVWEALGNLNDYRRSGFVAIKVWAPDAAAGQENGKGFFPSTYSQAAYRPSLTLDYYEMPVRVAADQGGLLKQAVSLRVAPDQGGALKNVVHISAAPDQGSARKTVF